MIIESCIIEFIKLFVNSLLFYLFSPTCLIKSIKHEHSCKILYLNSKMFANIVKIHIFVVKNSQLKHGLPPVIGRVISHFRVDITLAQSSKRSP